MDNASMEMPKYQSHKKVWALKIKEVVFDWDMQTATITPEEDGYAPFKVDHAYVSKHKPKVGGYYVFYKDGYRSWSPADAFEEGYTKIQ